VPAETTAPFRYCPSCGERVYTYTVLKEGVVELRCSPCGFPVTLVQGPSIQALDCIITVDDNRFFLSFLADLLVDRGLTANVISCESAAQFLTSVTQRLHQGLPSPLAILDIVMEPMDGITAAMALRAVEQGLGAARPIPLLFLSAARYDETLSKLIARCQPALYLNKGSDATPDKLGPRLEKVIGYLLAQGRK
jgi:CheY-like chemotaxis protein